jgi:large subunit ribosomal protein L21
MYAIVDIAGQQIKVEKDQRIFVHLLEGDTGAPVHFNRVLLINNDKNILIGRPLLTDALITGKILSHVKGDKIKVFKKKRRKGYQVLKGHRQFFTEVQIEEIMEKGGIKILKDLATKREPKKEVKTEKTEKPIKAVKPVAKEIKPPTEKEPEVAPETKVVAKKPAELSEKKPKQSAKKQPQNQNLQLPSSHQKVKLKKQEARLPEKPEPVKLLNPEQQKQLQPKRQQQLKNQENQKINNHKIL